MKLTYVPVRLSYHHVKLGYGDDRKLLSRLRLKRKYIHFLSEQTEII